MTGATDPKTEGYTLRISPTTVDKLGVKLYDKVSAVVAELVANSYDADAHGVSVELPLNEALARKDRESGEIREPDPPWTITVVDDGHGMTPNEARTFFLEVGRDRRLHAEQGATSRELGRPVMGRKGIGKLAPFGICRTIEVLSSGGTETAEGYLTTNFLIDYDVIMSAGEADAGDQYAAGGVPLTTGEQDGTYRAERGTTIRLSRFLNRRVPSRETFKRQLERRFALATDDFDVVIRDSSHGGGEFEIGEFDVPVVESTRIDLADRPVPGPDGTSLPVRGQIGMATEPYRDEEMAGVRIYARGKIIATTRDFEQPAGYTGEFTTRSYLVGEVHADWLDADDGDDLIRTDRQDILWSSELGEALRLWGAELIKVVGNSTRAPRRERTRATFLDKSQIRDIAAERYPGENDVAEAAVELASQIGQYAAPDELEDEDYISGLREVILQVAPHRALMQAFQRFSQDVVGGEVQLEGLADLFGKTHVAEMASYGQIAHERVRAIGELQDALATATAEGEDRLQEILAKAPYLIEPTWSVITKNQTLRTFKSAFEAWYKQQTGDEVELTIDWMNKRPDFVLVDVLSRLNIVEIKKPQHRFSNDDFDRLARYVRAFRAFAEAHPEIMSGFPNGWRILLIADDVGITDDDKRESFSRFEERGEVKRRAWFDFLNRAVTSHQEFLEARDEAARQRELADASTPAALSMPPLGEAVRGDE